MDSLAYGVCASLENSSLIQPNMPAVNFVTHSLCETFLSDFQIPVVHYASTELFLFLHGQELLLILIAVLKAEA